MRIILDTIIDNPDLPLIDPAMALITDDTLAIYGMLDKNDASGRAGPLITNALFDNSGVILTNDANGVIETPVFETDEMTIVYAWNLLPSTTQFSVALSNLNPASAPFGGLRVGTLTTGVGQMTVATGGTSPSTTVVGTTISPGWTRQAMVLTNSKLTKYFATSLGTDTTLTARAKNQSIPFYLNGMPESVSASSRGGFTGYMGMVAFYNKAYTQAQVQVLLDKMKLILNERGVSIN